MSYSALKPNENYLRRFTTLDAARQSAAELEADRCVDRAFWRWDRALWSGDGLPPDIKRFWLLIASAEYITLDYAATNPGVGEIPMARELRDVASGIAEDCAARGWVVGQDGKPLANTDNGSSTLMMGILR